MSSAAAPPPITGRPIDPPPVDVPGYAAKLDRTAVGGVAYRAMRRYTYSNVGLLANGTAYYLILSVFSVLAFAYGVITIVGADRLAEVLTDALSEALPGLVGANGIDPAVLRKAGVTAGAVGLVFLLYGGLGAVAAASSSLHLIFGAPPDPRTFVKAKARQLVVLILAGILMTLSFAATGLTGTLVGPVLDAVGLGSGPERVAVGIGGFVVGVALDLLIMWLLLGWLGGIQPEPRPRLIAAGIGAVLVGIVKALLSVIVGWVIDKPQYGAFAAPLAVLFVFALLSQTLYVSAAIAAGISDLHRPLEDLHPDPVQRRSPEPQEGSEAGEVEELDAEAERHVPPGSESEFERPGTAGPDPDSGPDRAGTAGPAPDSGPDRPGISGPDSEPGRAGCVHPDRAPDSADVTRSLPESDR